jgi:phage gp36-like protein
MENAKKQLTSVKLDPEIFERFKINAILYKLTIQKLTERAMHLYNTDEEFRRKINNTKV